MRKQLSEAVFPGIRGELLSVLLLDPDRAWYLSDLAKQLATRPSSLQRELSRLTDVGILQLTRDGNRTYYRAAQRCPIFPELRSLLLKTTGMLPALEELLRGMDAQPLVAMVYGSFAQGTATSASDVDLLIVGDVRLTDIVAKLRKLESNLGREINPTIMSLEELQRRIQDGDHFLTSILGSPKSFIIGSERELGDLTGIGPTKAASDVSARGV